MTVITSPKHSQRPVIIVNNRSQSSSSSVFPTGLLVNANNNNNDTTSSLSPPASLSAVPTIPNNPNHTFATNPTLWLLIWTANNVSVTLLNKAAFKTVHFNYPFFLSAIHMICCIFGAHIIFYWIDHAKARRTKHILDMNNNNMNHNNNNTISQTIVEQIFGNNSSIRHPIDKTGKRYLFIFSIIFSLNIAIGNVSLNFVSVNFNQVMRSLVPVIIIIMGICLGKPCSKNRIIAVIPIVIGVAMACFGDMSYTMIGFFVTVAAIILAAFKVVASGELLTGKVSLHPVDLLSHMAPLALIQCMGLSLITGELRTMFIDFHNYQFEFNYSIYEILFNINTLYTIIVILLSGFFSFALNITSLQANKLTSPLTLCIAANVKQVVLMALSTILFGTEISLLNGLGIIIVLLSSARYSYISLIESNNNKTSSNSSTNASITNNSNSSRNTLLQQQFQHQKQKVKSSMISPHDNDDELISLHDDEIDHHNNTHDIELNHRHHSTTNNEEMKSLLLSSSSLPPQQQQQ